MFNLDLRIHTTTMEVIVKRNGLMRKPVTQLTPNELWILAYEVEHPALFFNGRSSMLSRNNTPRNGFKFEEIPTAGKILEVMETRREDKNSMRSSFSTCSLANSVGNALLWPMIRAKLRDESLVVDVDTRTGLVTFHERG